MSKKDFRIMVPQNLDDVMKRIFRYCSCRGPLFSFLPDPKTTASRCAGNASVSGANLPRKHAQKPIFTSHQYHPASLFLSYHRMHAQPFEFWHHGVKNIISVLQRCHDTVMNGEDWNLRFFLHNFPADAVDENGRFIVLQHMWRVPVTIGLQAFQHPGQWRISTFKFVTNTA